MLTPPPLPAAAVPQPGVRTTGATVNSRTLHSQASPSLQAMECVLRGSFKVYSYKDAAAWHEWVRGEAK